MKLELHDKLEFQKSDKFLIISQTMVHCQISLPNMVFGHFGLINKLYIYIRGFEFTIHYSSCSYKKNKVSFKLELIKKYDIFLEKKKKNLTYTIYYD